MKQYALKCMIVAFLLGHYASADPADWYGLSRDGRYDEDNLLTTWPQEGPELQWISNSIGEGYSSPTIANGNIYITGSIKGEGHLFCFNRGGTLLWEVTYGSEWKGSYKGSRATPSIQGDLLYITTGHGRFICINIKSKKIVWSKDLEKDFNANLPSYGYTESVLIDNNRVICTPGGSIHNVMALNRFNGDTVWSCKAKGEKSAYCSPSLVTHNAIRLVVTITAESVLCINADTGELYCSYPYRVRYPVHPNTPLYHDGYLYCVSGYGHEGGGMLLKLSDDAKDLDLVWRNYDLDCFMGGVILSNGHLYGCSKEHAGFHCVDWTTGKTKYSSQKIDSGSTIYADGMLYGYSENGVLALIQPDPNHFHLVNATKIKKGRGPHFTRPVIDNGILYIRRGNSLMAFSIGFKDEKDSDNIHRVTSLR